MPFPELLRRVTARLDEADSGSRGWFLITRVHLSAALLKTIADYLYSVGAAEGVTLENPHYAALASAAGIAGTDPGRILRRHHLLAMETPLSLLRRTHGASWRSIRLTSLGTDLATVPETSAVLENTLDAIVFCREPYYTERRVSQYDEFEIHPYRATLRVLRRCGGWIDRDEYDLFLSRIRRPQEISWAIEGIKEFRTINTHERGLLLGEVRQRIPGKKSYTNWRDMGLHTFSLFSLGTSAIRVDQSLWLTTSVAEEMQVPPEPRPVPAAARMRQPVVLRIPVPPPNPGLTAPPGMRELNPGDEGELIVAKLLRAAGWNVVFYTNRRGYGFDLWAQRGASVMVVEVKSSFERLGSVTLTRLEYEAAQRYAENFCLATVENIHDNPAVRFVLNPARLRHQVRQTREFVIARAEWEEAAEQI